MKLKYKSIGELEKQSVVVANIKMPSSDDDWHYHDEFELIYNIKGKGTRIVGDHLTSFKDQELVLVGCGLPHLWKNEVPIDDADHVETIITKFRSDFSGHDFFDIPEFADIKELLELSQRGLKFGKNITEQVHGLLVEMEQGKAASRVISLLQILFFLAESKDYVFLSSADFTLTNTKSEEFRLNKIMNFVSNNYTQQVSLDDISNEAAMTPNSLCRFFKNHTNKTIFQFLNEYRIGKACHLLINGNQSITEICFETGFNSLTSFNRVFKELKKVTPREFKSRYKILNTDFSLQSYSA